MNDQNVIKNRKTVISLAPLEGITTFIYRRVFARHFTGVDKYYTPFLSANETKNFRKREKAEFMPYDDKLVPQLLANDPEEFIYAAKQLASFGYREVNLNMGCPSGTVVAKGKGSGMLSDTNKLASFFDSVFAEKDIPLISVKMRIGMNSITEAKSLTSLISDYPFCDVIIHPRTRSEFYDGPVHIDIFAEMSEAIGYDRVTYNGQINSVSDFEHIQNELPGCTSFMLGRGLIARPSLASEISGGEPFSREELSSFLDDLWSEYSEWNSNEKQILDKMKELWTYIGRNFPDKKRALKELKKSHSAAEYRAIVFEILS